MRSWVPHPGTEMRGDGTAEYLIAPTPHAPAEARRRLAAHPAGLTAARLGDGALAVSELVTFGLREELFPSRPGASFALRIETGEDRLSVELGHAPTRNGRGWFALRDNLVQMVVLNVVTSEWGVLPDGAGVWFTIDAS